MPRRMDRQLETIPNTQFSVDQRELILDRLLPQAEPFGNLTVGSAAAENVDDLTLS